MVDIEVDCLLLLLLNSTITKMDPPLVTVLEMILAYTAFVFMILYIKAMWSSLRPWTTLTMIVSTVIIVLPPRVTLTWIISIIAIKVVLIVIIIMECRRGCVASPHWAPKLALLIPLRTHKGRDHVGVGLIEPVIHELRGETLRNLRPVVVVDVILRVDVARVPWARHVKKILPHSAKYIKFY